MTDNGVSVGREAATIDGWTVRFPYEKYHRHRVFDEHVVVSLSSGGDGLADPDFELPRVDRNVVAFDRDGAVAWFVEEPPHGREREPMGGYDDDWTGTEYVQVYGVQGRLVVKNLNDRFYEVDLGSGSILDSWRETQMKVGDELRTFDGRVGNLFDFEGRVFLTESRPESGVAFRIWAFDPDGSVVWRRDSKSGFFHTGGFRGVGENVLVQSVDYGKDRYVHFRLDPDTGEQVEILDADMEDPVARLEGPSRFVDDPEKFR